jgi:hypothetical protein
MTHRENTPTRENALSLNLGTTPLLTLVEQFWSGFQSGVDQAVMNYALLHNKPISGWVPAGNRAEVETAPGIFSDCDRGIPVELIRIATLTESTPENIQRFISRDTTPPNVAALADRTLRASQQNPALPAIRTELLVADTEATLILTTGHSSLVDGTMLMESFAKDYNKPVHVVVFNENGVSDMAACDNARIWLRTNTPRLLNVGGPRASHGKMVGYSIAEAASRAIRQIFED